jgi:dTDP-4-dehydrorhamnose reductase
MSYLIVGGNGMLGRALRIACERDGRPFRAVGLPGFDISNESQVEAAVSGHSVIFNCAAYTNVDGAESDEATANRVNGLGVELLAKACAKRGILLVHYSTDYVFSGHATEPYRVDEPHAPSAAYGRSKALGERALWNAGGPHLLLRTSWLYAPWGKNFVRTIASASARQSVLTVVNDQRGRPGSAEHVARTSLDLLDRKASGTLHVTDGGECTWFEFAQEIVRLSGNVCEVRPCTSAELARPAKRPSCSVLDLALTEKLVGPMPHWRDNLRSVMSRLEPL